MGRARRVVGWAVVCLLVAAASSASAEPVASAASAWAGPSRLAAPVSPDVVPGRTAFSPTRATAVGYSVQDMDNPADSTARVLQGRGGARFGASRTVPGQQQILDLAYGSAGLELLAGASEAGRACCSQVSVLGPAHGGSFGRARVLFSGLAGAALARLVNLPNRLLAVAATELGVWVSQSASGAGDRFAPARRLSAANQLPQSLEAIGLPHGQSLVAWTARKDRTTADGPREIYIARGSVQQAPARPRLALTVPANHQVDEIALAQGAGLPTLAWIESWFDRNGNFHSEAKVADLSGKLRPQAVSSDSELAAGLAFAAAAGGDQALTWKACTSTGDCATRAVLRRANGRFGSVQRPGPIDAGDTPVAAVTLGGRALIGWVHSGHVLAASSQTTRLSRATVVSSTGFAADLALTAAPTGGALAVWTQGTLAQSVMGADFRGR